MPLKMFLCHLTTTSLCSLPFFHCVLGLVCPFSIFPCVCTNIFAVNTAQHHGGHKQCQSISAHSAAPGTEHT